MIKSKVELCMRFPAQGVLLLLGSDNVNIRNGFIFVFSSMFALTTSAVAAGELTHPTLKIVFSGFPLKETVGKSTLEFDKSCKEFGKYFVKNRGLWGSGPFASVDCTQDKEPSEWTLKVSGDGSKKNFDIVYRDEAGAESVESHFEIETEINPIILMNKKGTKALIAADLIFGLPFRATIRQSAVKQDAVIAYKSFAAKKLPLPGEALQIFALTRANGVWQPHIVATAEFDSMAATPRWKITNVDQEVLSQFQSSAQGAVFFVQQSNDRDAARLKIEDLIRADVSSFFAKFFNVARSAYVGMRYGIPLGGGDGVLAKAPLMGFFGEFRGGMLNGLKLSYDVIPLQEETTDLSKDEFSWSRLQLGYSFGRKLNNRLINWVDVTPKLGVTNLLLKSTAAAGSNLSSYAFELHRSPTLGAEIGLENRSSWLLARLWGYASYSVGVVSIDKKYRSSSLRAGLDVYRDIMFFKKIKVALLGFTAADSSSYTKTLSDSELASDPDQTKAIKFTSLYAGGGLTLTW